MSFKSKSTSRFDLILAVLILLLMAVINRRTEYGMIAAIALMVLFGIYLWRRGL